MQTDRLLRMVKRVPTANDRPPVATLDAVPVIPQPCHELGPDFGNLLRPEPTLGRLVGESIAWHRRRHDVERIVGRAAMRNRVRERPDNLRELGDGPRPTVRDDQRGGIRLRGALVNKVRVESVEHRLELVEFVQPAFLLPPVKTVPPVTDQIREIAQLGAIVPVGAIQLIGQPGVGQPRLEILEHGV